MTDEAKALVQRLREVGRDGVWKSGRNPSTAHPMCIEAADLIETQAREIERLRGAISAALRCTPQARHGAIIYDCGTLGKFSPQHSQETAMTSELRPASEVWLGALITWDDLSEWDYQTRINQTTAVIEADRAATRAAVVAEICEWLQSAPRITHCFDAADQIAQRFGGRYD